MPDEKLRILVTFALEPELIEQVRAVDPQRIEIDVLGRDQRQLLRGFKYPSERERAAVAEGLQGAFAQTDLVFGFWGAELHNAIKLEGSIREVAPRLKWIQLTSAGADRLLSSGFIEEGIVVTTVSGLHATPIGEYVLTTILMFAKGMPRTMRAQVRGEWSRFAPTELRGKTVGIVGMGRIGKAIARRLEAFGVPVVYHSRNPQAGVTYKYYPKLIDMARDVDTLMVIVPGGAATKNLIDAEVLKALGPNGILINMARGSVVDEPALIKALKDRTIMSAGLDVFVNEPQVPQELIEMEHIVLFPHLGSASVATRKAMDQLVVDNLEAHFAGRPLPTPVL